MNLTEFSTEILLQICEEFCHHCQEKHLENPETDSWTRGSSRHALLDLSLVNRKIGAIAQRVLHHHCGYVDRYSEPEDVVRFCRTICENPELGKCLRWANLSLLEAETDRDVFPGWLPDAIEAFGHHITLDAHSLVEDWPDSSIAPLIMLQAPNLERIDDDGKEEGTCLRLLSSEARTAVGDGALLQNLTSAWLGSHLPCLGQFSSPGPDLSWWALGCLLSSLPKLHTLTLYCPMFSSPDEQLSLQHVRVLRISHFFMPRDDFERLISGTPMLEEFAHFYLALPAVHRGDTATVSDICEALTMRKDTLRRVILGASCTTDDIQALRGLDNLEELKIWAGPFLEAQSELDILNPLSPERALPPSLQKLHVKSTTPGLTLACEALLMYIEGTYRESPEEQKLKNVFFDVYDEPAREYLPFKNSFGTRCHNWLKHGTVVFSVKRFDWYDMGDWISGEVKIYGEGCSL